MATNYRQAKQDDSSDDEGPTKRVKHEHHDDDDDEPVIGRPAQAPAANKKGSRNMWADVVQEEELTIRSNVIDMHDYKKRGGDLVKISRGAESYTVPTAMLEENAAALEAHKHIYDEQPPAPASSSDDPFGDTADLGEVEAFGVGPSSGRNTRGWLQPRGGRGRGVRGGWMNKQQQQPSRTETGDDSMEMGEGAADAAAAAAGSGQRGRGRGGWRGAPRGFVPRGRGGHWGGRDDRKRRWNDHGYAHAKDPKELMDGGYSLAGLLATEFEEGLTLKELGEAIAKAFGERESDTVVRITEAVGEKKALELFEEVKKAEQAGGVKVADGSRNRTPGGVFILFFKADVDVEPEVKGSIFDDTKNQQRKIAKARKRKQINKETDVSQDLDELQKLLEEKKKELASGGKPESPEEGEATPSPDNGDAEELDYSEDESPEGTEME